ncbi:SOS response-associated peptidase [Rhodohalobacter sp. 8-1]|uniref:SOS response-associated peptidase n=1 Tax=Rhodohalobacter sp. 8-1 TaxID=3131972 RepID=UPI0030EFA46F
MCGRYVLKATLEELQKTYGAVLDGTFPVEPNYNVAPSHHMPVVLKPYESEEANRIIRPHRWGLVPFWADSVKTGYSMINARGESLSKKKSFQKPFKSQRCIVPANGFYEWKTTSSEKVPHFVQRKQSNLMHFAGLWEEWQDPDSGETINSYTIITTDANKPMQELHDRMPALLLQEEFNTWLDPSFNDTEALQDLIRPWPDDDIKFYRVNKEVGNVSNNRPELIEPYRDLFS